MCVHERIKSTPTHIVLICAAVCFIFLNVITANVIRFSSDIMVAWSGNGCSRGRIKMEKVTKFSTQGCMIKAGEECQAATAVIKC